MKIVIDINDNEYLGIKNYPDNITSYPVTIHLYEAVRNGTVLSEPHGRLIDADVLADGFEDNYEFCEVVNATPTIIESSEVRE